MTIPLSSSIEAEVPAMSYVEFCHAYWRKGYQYPYPVPRHSDPSPAPSYREYEELRRKMELGDDFVDQRWQNLIRACYEYLAGPQGKQVSLSEVLAFLNQPPLEVLTTLAGYQPVYGWLLKGEQLLKGTATDDVFWLHRIEGATEIARYCVQDCIDFPAKEKQLQQKAAEEAGKEAELQRKRDQRQVEHEKSQRKKEREIMLQSAISNIFLFGAGLIAGFLIACWR